MSKTEQIIHKFVDLIETHLPKLKTIVWDLDGTLGALPGWNGTNLNKYIGFDLKTLLSFLTNEYHIQNVLISRNGMFCDDEFSKTIPMFLKLGFDKVEKCYQQQPNRSKTSSFRAKRTVMLIDDQYYECERAINEGCHAMHLKDHIGRGFLKDKYIVYVQE